MKKIGSVIKVNNDDIKLKVGTIDKKCPDVIYLEGGFYIKPIQAKEDYKSDIKKIKQTFDDLVKNLITKDENFKNEYMIFVDVADEWIKTDKKSFLSFQLFVKPSVQILDKEKNFNNVFNYLKNNTSYDTSLIKNLFNENGYEIYKSKKN